MRSDLEIRHDGRTRVVPREKVYFPFASGRLTYDCRACPVPCCRRGFGYWVNSEAERRAQLSAAPHLRHFLEPGHAPGYEKITAHPPGCFFLDEEGLCRIHLEEGAAKKPLTCRLFPFNRMLQVGHHLIVGPKAGLCPLQVAPAGEESRLSSHDDLFETMAREGMDRFVFPGTGLIEDVTALFELERQVVELSEEYLDTGGPLLAFLDDQSALARESLRSAGGASVVVAEDGLGSAAVLARRAAEALGTSEAELQPFEADVRRSVVALTPALRSALVFYQTGGPRVREGGAVGLDRVPAAVLAVAILAQLAKLAGMPGVTPQTVWSLFRVERALVWALAHLDAVPRWGGEALDDPRFIAGQRAAEGPFGDMAAALLPVRQRQERVRLIDLLREHGGSQSPLEQARWLKDASRRMYTRVVVV